MSNQKKYDYRLVLGSALKGLKQIPKEKRSITRTKQAKPTIEPQKVVRAVKATTGSKELIAQIPSLGKWQVWLPTATFTVCQKTGTATYLDIFDADHFDGFTDMQRNLSECRVWFSASGFSYWGSSETKTGRINCYFRAPSAGDYVCNVQLESYGGEAKVQCLMDEYDYGTLTVNGAINQPHVATLSSGYHHFRIRQLEGSFFFVSLIVWKV